MSVYNNYSQEPKDKVMSLRVSEREKRLLKKMGVTLRDVLDLFFKEHGSNQNELVIKRELMVIKVDKFKKELEDIQLELIDYERELERIDENLEHMSDENDMDKKYDDVVMRAVNNIIDTGNRRINSKHFKKTSSVFEDYLTSAKGRDYISRQSKLVGVPADVLVRLVYKKLCKQV